MYLWTHTFMMFCFHFFSIKINIFRVKRLDFGVTHIFHTTFIMKFFTGIYFILEIYLYHSISIKWNSILNMAGFNRFSGNFSSQ